LGHNLARYTKRREKEDECGSFKGWQTRLRVIQKTGAFGLAEFEIRNLKFETKNL
jgi:hypothetical protein